jgi:phage regulator Rha-like protein
MSLKEITKFQEQTMTSLEIAKLTDKAHKNVLADIRKILEDAEISSADFSAVYKDQQLIERPCFNLPRRECDLVISGYSVKYRLAIIDRWIALEAKESARVEDALRCKQLRAEARVEYLPMTDAIKQAHGEPKFYHFSNEADLINRIVFGCTAKKFKAFHEIEKDDALRDYLSTEQINAVLSLQRANTALIQIGMEYLEREENLRKLFDRHHSQKLIQEHILLEA